MTQNVHVCTICCRMEVVYDVIFGRNVKTIESYLAVNFEIACSNGFRDIQKNHFVTAEAATDIDDTIKRNRFRVSRNNNNNVLLDAKHKDISASCRIVRRVV